MDSKFKELEGKVKDLEIVLKYYDKSLLKEVPIIVLAKAFKNGEKLAEGHEAEFHGSLLFGEAYGLEKRGLIPVICPCNKEEESKAVKGFLFGEPVFY